MKFKESELAHQYLDGLRGLEIGGAAHNPFGLVTLNVDYTSDMETVFKQAEFALCGEKMPVDIVSSGDDLPLKDNTQDFVISSHVIEHFFDPIKAIKEWLRVIQPGGFIFIIAPISSMIPGELRPTTTFDELLQRHLGKIEETEILNKVVADNDGILGSAIIEGILYDTKHGHWTVFDVDLIQKICLYLDAAIVEIQDVDDKVGNGFTIVIQKELKQIKPFSL